MLDTKNAINFIYESGALGAGFGSRYDIIYTTDWLNDFIEHVSRASHNGYLYILMKTGLIGFISWTLLWATVFFASLFLVKASKQTNSWILSAIASVLIISAVANMFYPYIIICVQ